MKQQYFVEMTDTFGGEGVRTLGSVRSAAKRELGLSIARKYFN